MSLERIGVFNRPDPKRRTFKPVFTEDALDWKIHRAAQTPGPGEYGNPDQQIIKGGRWGKEMPLSYLDVAEMHGRQSPGPGAYNAMEALKRQEGSTNGGRFNMSKPKTFLESVEYATKGIPGPASYEITRDVPAKGGRFNMSKSKTDVEWIMYRSAQIPAPGKYNFKEHTPNGGKFNMANPKTPLDWQIKLAKTLPGPGQYYTQSDANAGVSGGKFNSSNSKSDLDWTIYRAERCPGPASYSLEGPHKFVARSVPKFSFQGRSGPATLPSPFQNFANSRASTASLKSTMRSRSSLSFASKSLDATAELASPAKGSGGQEAGGPEVTYELLGLRSTTASPGKPNESRLKDTEKRFTERLQNAYNKSTMRRKASSTMGFGSSFFL
mmetsp:Transcript_19565/g.31204  ORF Transcript_19565/g.31204 Transcript_19565/m.31204 type:complete len:383 (+) Transcript_19565:122-1270(+)